MIENKNINKVTIALATILLISTGIFFIVGEKYIAASYSKPEYVETFGKDIFSINIISDEKSWQDMLDNAANEEYIQVNIEINGEKYESVGIRPKGNSSLSQVVSSDSNRYSFKIKMDQYVKGQTYKGLDTFVVNNMISDPTYMKEYISYDIMEYIGVDTPLNTFVDLNLNGESIGLYLAVESYNDSFLDRVYGNSEGELYSVKSMEMGDMGTKVQKTEGIKTPPNLPLENGANNASADQENRIENPDERQNSDTQTEFSKDSSENLDIQQAPESFEKNTNLENTNRVNQRPMDMGNKGSNGGDLVYSDDNISSYCSIFDNVVGNALDSDKQRVVSALQNLSEGTKLEESFDIDKILRYLAAHTVVVNLDSYSSSMAQNYYIYEKDGQITILPWDYNLAFGGFQNNSSSSVVNFPIDTPVSGVEMEDRPLINQLLQVEKYKEKYHQYINEILEGYFENGAIEVKIAQLGSVINQYVKNDPTAFYTYEQYQKAVTELTKLCQLRAKSIKGQLEGEIPSTTIEQNENPDKLVDASSVDLSILGDMKGGEEKMQIMSNNNKINTAQTN